MAIRVFAQRNTSSLDPRPPGTRLRTRCLSTRCGRRAGHNERIVMWQVVKSSVDVSTESWQVCTRGDQVLEFVEVVRLWRGNAEFRAFWNASLREVPFDAHCWECPPITVQSSSRPFECVF